MSVEAVQHTGISNAKITENELNTECTDLFTIPTYDQSMVDSNECSHSADSVNHNGPYRVTIAANPKQYIYTKKMTCLLTLSVENEKGETPVTTSYAVAPNIGSSLFQSVQVWIKGQKISELTQEYYAHKAYLEHILSYSPSTLKSHFSTGVFHVDSPGHFDSTNDTNNTGYKKRKEICAGGKQFQVMTDLSVDVLQTDRLLLPSTEITLVFERSPDSFHIHKPAVAQGAADEKLRIKIHELKIYVHYITLHDDLRSFHLKELVERNKKALLPFQKTEVFTKQFGTGVTRLYATNCIQSNHLPRTVIVGLLETAALDGDYTKNPFNFKTFNVQSVSLKINGTSVPAEPINVDYDNKKYARACKRISTELGYYRQDISSVINFDSFVGGYCFYPFDLNPDKCNGFHLHDSGEGIIDVRIDLNGGSTKGITMMVISTHERGLTLDRFLNPEILEF